MQESRRALGLPGRRRRPRHRQPPRQPRRPRPRRRRRDPAQSPAQPGGLRLPPRLGRRHGRVPQLRRPGARHRLGAGARHVAGPRPPACCCRPRSATRRSSSPGWSAATAASWSWSRARNARCRSPSAGSPTSSSAISSSTWPRARADGRTTPALVFCFNRDECWSVAEMLKGLDLLAAGRHGPLNDEVDKLDWTQGVGPKLKQMLRRGVGVHHAGHAAQVSPRRRESVHAKAAGRRASAPRRWRPASTCRRGRWC